MRIKPGNFIATLKAPISAGSCPNKFTLLPLFGLRLISCLSCMAWGPTIAFALSLFRFQLRLDMRLLPIVAFALLLLLISDNSLGATPQVAIVPLIKESILKVRIINLLCHHLNVLLSFVVDPFYAARQLAIVTTPHLKILSYCSWVSELLKTILIHWGVLVIAIPMSEFVRQAIDGTTSLWSTLRRLLSMTLHH